MFQQGEAQQQDVRKTFVLERDGYIAPSPHASMRSRPKKLHSIIIGRVVLVWMTMV